MTTHASWRWRCGWPSAAWAGPGPIQPSAAWWSRTGHIAGRGWTQDGGRPHAEVEALRRAGSAALGATAYISLEPCAHYGWTPPCTMALLHAGIRRVVAATRDPDPRVNGQGLAQLRQAGVEVEEGVRQAEAEALNAGFFRRFQANRPLVTLKLATSLDGRIATRTGHSQWITGEEARARGHWLRASHDAIMIGSGTALADDPSLTCRLRGLGASSPVRIVLDGRLRLPNDANLVRTARDVPIWVIAREDASGARIEALRERGVHVLHAPTDAEGRLELGSVLGLLAGRGLTRVLVEGGAALAASLLRARLVDRLVWFQAPMLIGGDGMAALGDLGVEEVRDALRLITGPEAVLSGDRMHTYMVRDS